MTDPERALPDLLGLGRHARPRVLLKRAYCRIVDPFDQGRRIPLTGGFALRVPTYFATAAWSNYEEAAMGAFLHWVRGHPGAILVDVGCSVAIYSLVALQASQRARVFALDPDRISLKTTAEFCRFADTGRLSLVQAFATDRAEPGLSLAQAIATTRETLASPGIPSEPTAVRYLRLDVPVPTEQIPKTSLDALFLEEIPPGVPVLIKVDVEGAELIVLRGAGKLLGKRRPAILLSVHPRFLPSFGHTAGDIASVLREHGYRWTVLSIDHEEHWWCEPDSGASG